mgnify:CR=1 FL=1
MDIPCGHPESVPGCHLCHLADTVEAYRLLWRTPVCRFKGRPATQDEKADNDLDQVKNFTYCHSPRQPLGMLVCECAGCGPLCPDYKVLVKA